MFNNYFISYFFWVIFYRGWDIFPQQSVKWNRDDMEQFWRTAEKLMTICFIFFIFLIVLGTGLLSRITLHLLIWHLYPPASHSIKINYTNNDINHTDVPVHNSTKNTQATVDEKWVWSVFTVIIAPYFVAILTSLKTMCLKRTRSITLGHLFLVRFNHKVP